MRINLEGKRAFVAGVSDDVGFGFAIAKAYAEAGASVTIGVWPPAMNIFETMLRRGKMDDSRKLERGGMLEFERIYPLDAVYDTLAEAPEEIRQNKRYNERGDFSIQGLADSMRKDFGPQGLDIVAHSLANGPEVGRPLMNTTRAGYLAAVSASAYSYVSLVQRLAPLMNPGGSFVSLSYLASERSVARYGGGMSAAKAALEADTRYLAMEAGRRHGLRVNAISAGPVATRAASVTGSIKAMIEHYRHNAPLPKDVTVDDVAGTAAFLACPLAGAITGTLLHVDNGYHSVGKALGPGDEDWVLGKLLESPKG
jgi:enoyl-[acyl-carrier protein] reductase I